MYDGIILDDATSLAGPSVDSAGQASPGQRSAVQTGLRVVFCLPCVRAGWVGANQLGIDDTRRTVPVL